jgi:hypothetical protein
MERSPRDGGDEGAKGFPSLPTVIFPLRPLRYISTSIKCLLLAKYDMTITTNMHMNRMAGLNKQTG